MENDKETKKPKKVVKKIVGIVMVLLLASGGLAYMMNTTLGGIRVLSPPPAHTQPRAMFL